MPWRVSRRRRGRRPTQKGEGAHTAAAMAEGTKGPNSGQRATDPTEHSGETAQEGSEHTARTGRGARRIPIRTSNRKSPVPTNANR
eukprot:12766825-Alexandrium_andersonii.AAC.1